MENYLTALKEEFAIINEYNGKIISFGFVAFFAMATYVKDSAPKEAFVTAIFLMSISIAIFVFYELFRVYNLMLYSSNKAKALEKLPDENPMKLVENTNLIFRVRIQKWTKYFFFPSMLFGLAALVLLFYCYIKVLSS